MDDYASDVREELGLNEDDFFILQPTRVVPRKGIEQAIKLVSLLKIPMQAGDFSRGWGRGLRIPWHARTVGQKEGWI